MLKKLLGVSALALLLAVPASAATITYQDLGTAAPPATLGGQTMTAFPTQDARGDFTDVTDVASPLGGSVGFSTPLEIRDVPESWLTWSHGYTDDVYYTQGAAYVTLSLPASTTAFYFYGEPNVVGTTLMVAAASDGTFFHAPATQPVDGQGGARGFGFYTSDTTIASITVGSFVDFAIGEFGIATTTATVPEPASLLLLGTGVTGLLARRRKKAGRS